MRLFCLTKIQEYTTQQKISVVLFNEMNFEQVVNVIAFFFTLFVTTCMYSNFAFGMKRKKHWKLGMMYECLKHNLSTNVNNIRRE